MIDDPEEYAGAPITVQLVCRRFREEECIGLGGVVADALKATTTKEGRADLQRSDLEAGTDVKYS